jgi:hypothetical protein
MILGRIWKWTVGNGFQWRIHFFCGLQCTLLTTSLPLQTMHPVRKINIQLRRHPTTYQWKTERLWETLPLISPWNKTSLNCQQLNSGAVYFKNIQKCLHLHFLEVLSFPTTYLCDAGFSKYATTKTDYCSRLDVAPDMRIQFVTALYTSVDSLTRRNVTVPHTSTKWSEIDCSSLSSVMNAVPIQIGIPI